MKKQIIKKARMAYWDEGAGFPLIFGHSFLWDTRMWQAQTAFLKKEYRCIVPDLWSHGQSDPLPYENCSLETLADDYWQLAQSLSLHQFAVIGLSVGGMWAVHLALAHPEAVTALVLMDTYVGSEPQVTQEVYLSLLNEIASHPHISPEFARKVAPYFFAKTTQEERPALVEDFITHFSAVPKAHILGKVNLGKAIFNRRSLLDDLKNIHVPTLIIVGEEDLPRPPDEAREMAALIPHAQLEIIPKAGHICTVERPAYVNEILSRFLTRIERV